MAALPIAAARLLVANTRLSRMRCLCAADHLRPAIGSPARFTTASALSIADAQAPAVPSGVHGSRRGTDARGFAVLAPGMGPACVLCLASALRRPLEAFLVRTM